MYIIRYRYVDHTLSICRSYAIEMWTCCRPGVPGRQSIGSHTATIGLTVTIALNFILVQLFVTFYGVTTGRSLSVCDQVLSMASRNMATSSRPNTPTRTSWRLRLFPFAQIESARAATLAAASNGAPLAPHPRSGVAILVTRCASAIRKDSI